MDEATKLVSELQHKLQELDHKVWQYRRDMASEFEKYAEDLLRGVPKDVSETVSKSIAESIKGCRSLYLDGVRSIESSATGSIQANGAGQPQPGLLPIATPSQGQDTDKTNGSPRSPVHEREKEFQGLFTPSYLPLLDSTSRNERRSSLEPPPFPSPRQEFKEKQAEMDPLDVEASTDTRSFAATPDPPRPATPKRRNTDEASIQSDWSDGPVRRSALRRSSSSSKGHSPRRVRFDVAGEEVLPTASPLPFKSVLAEDIPPTSFGHDLDEEAGAEQIEDVDEPPPKRISSSQALRALSRSPLVDDGTEWTTVTAPPDGSASVATSNDFQGSAEDDDEQLEIRNGRPKSNISNPFPRASSPETPAENEEEEQAETPSDDEMLDMPPLIRQSSHANVLSPIDPPDIANNKSATASTRSPGKPLHSLEMSEGIPQTIDSQPFAEDYDHDDLFRFDDGTEERSPPPFQDEEEEDESEESAAESPDSPIKEEPVTLSSYSRSPARDIVMPNHSSPTTQASKGVVGSYKGRPFTIPIVSAEVHAQAASLGEVNSFVGSVHGRSGLDESDSQSFRASLRNSSGPFSGTPRSMTERMLMDDILETEEMKRKYS